MSLSDHQRLNVKTVLRNSLRNKFAKYNPEPGAMPFHTRLLGKDRMALFSFIQSLNTNFGTTIFEPVATSLASAYFKEVTVQQTAGSHISSEAQMMIQDILDGLTVAKKEPKKISEIELIRKVCQSGEIKKIKPTKVDLKAVSHKDEIYLFDIKTAKPNAGNFKDFKRTLLEWVATTLIDNPNAKIHTLIAIPYNPYAPNPYSRWTMRGMLDLDEELKVAEEFWDFLGGDGSYEDMLICFEEVGIELRPEVDAYFAKFHKL